MGQIEGWEGRLLAEFDRWTAIPFAWGAADCLSFCRACEVAVTGGSRFADMPNYATAKEAMRHLKDGGFANAADGVNDRLPSIPPMMARRGDWVMREDRVFAFGAFGVVAGRMSAHMGENGLVFLPLAGTTRAWRIA